MSKTVALIVAAGKGERAGGGVPKQYRMLGPKPVLAHAFDSLAAHPGIGGLVLVVAPGEEERAREVLDGREPLAIVAGGETRRESVRAGLEAIMEAEVVLIHDAARPFVPATVTDRLLEALEDDVGAVPVLPIADTVAQAGTELGPVVDRASLLRVQTPQAFRFDAVLAVHRDWAAEEPTDDAQMVRAAGYRIATVTGDSMLDKITVPQDFAVMEARLGGPSTRTGMGFDVHRLADGEELWLGGVQIPHEQGLLGHSDADVALHALTDAVLGAIAAGDIGQHFPPSDPQWRGARSARFLEHAAALVERANARIEHVDLTIICEAPKVGPHRDTIRTRIADLLRLPTDRVSVKATTTERLGFTGRGEGIAAQAVATVSLYEANR